MIVEAKAKINVQASFSTKNAVLKSLQQSTAPQQRARYRKAWSTSINFWRLIFRNCWKFRDIDLELVEVDTKATLTIPILKSQGH